MITQTERERRANEFQQKLAEINAHNLRVAAAKAAALPALSPLHEIRTGFRTVNRRGAWRAAPKSMWIGVEH